MLLCCVASAAGLPTRDLARKSLAGIPRRAGISETATEELLSPEPLELLPWEPAENPGNRRAICLLEPLIPTPWGLREALNGGLGASIKRTPGVIENGSFQGIWGLAHGGVFSATEYGHLIPGGY